jgi:hypothetical protein
MTGPRLRTASLPASTRLAAGSKQTVPQDGSHVHQIIDWSGRRPALLRQHRHGYAAGLHRGLPTAGTKRLRSRTHSGARALHTGPYPPDLEPASRLRSVQHWFAYAAPSDLARRARTVWQYRHGSPSRGRLPPITVVPGDRLPRCFIRPLRRPNRDGLSPPLDTSGASWRTAPPRRNLPLVSEFRWLSEVLSLLSMM